MLHLFERIEGDEQEDTIPLSHFMYRTEFGTIANGREL